MNDRSHATPPVNRFYPRALSSTVRGGKRKRKKEEHRQDTRKRLEVNLVAGLIIQTRRAARRCIVLEPISISSKRWTTNNRWRMPFKRQKVEVGDFETRAVIRRCLPPWTCLAIDKREKRYRLDCTVEGAFEIYACFEETRQAFSILLK